MKRKHKRYSRPKKPFEKGRIDEEGRIKEEFGLKNKREIWKANSQVSSIRGKAKRLIKSSPEEQKALFKRLQKIGLKVNSISDVLALETKDYLERRLQTIVARKGIVPTMKSARQNIVHKKILVNGKVVNVPSYIVPVDLENKIGIKEKKKIKHAEIPEGEMAEAERKMERTGHEIMEMAAEAGGN